MFFTLEAIKIYIVTALQLIVALTILNVWLVRFKKSTKYRGGNAKNLKEEFEVYGLPKWFMYIVGFVKVATALVLIVGIAFPYMIYPAAEVMAVLMLGAIGMHVRVKDRFIKMLPALTILVMCGAIILLIRTF